jgi:cobalt/nickel transport system permease protein
MAGGHIHALYRHGDSRIHRLAPHLKIVAAVGFVFAVVATPREALWAFGLYAATLAALATAARLGVRFVTTRMIIEVPFVIVALLLPFFAGGERIDVLGVALSRGGLWDMWNIVAKATLGLLTSIVLAGTTQVPHMLRGFDTLRVPRVMTAIMGFMIRYLDVVLDEFRRMHVAMHSRGYRPRWLGHVTPYARSLGRLFVRSFERGERVYLAMASRGYAGTMPAPLGAPATAADWVGAGALLLGAWAVAVIALLTA